MNEWEYPDRIPSGGIAYAQMEAKENIFTNWKNDKAETSYTLGKTKHLQIKFAFSWKQRTNYWYFRVEWENLGNLGTDSQEFGWRYSLFNMGKILHFFVLK